MAKPSRSSTLPPPHIRTGTSTFHFEKANVIQMGDLFFQRDISLHRPRYGGHNHWHYCRRRQKFSRSPAMTPRLFRGMARSATKRTSRNSGTCSSLRAIAFQKIEVRGENLPRKPSRRKPFADLDPVWGKGVVNGDQWVQIVYLTL